MSRTVAPKRPRFDEQPEAEATLSPPSEPAPEQSNPSPEDYPRQIAQANAGWCSVG